MSGEGKEEEGEAMLLVEGPVLAELLRYSQDRRSSGAAERQAPRQRYTPPYCRARESQRVVVPRRRVACSRLERCGVCLMKSCSSDKTARCRGMPVTRFGHRAVLLAARDMRCLRAPMPTSRQYAFLPTNNAQILRSRSADIRTRGTRRFHHECASRPIVSACA